MSYKRGNPKTALRNRKKFLKSLGLNLNSIVCMSPFHSTRVVRVSKKDVGKGSGDISQKIPTDSLITKTKELYLFVTTGDCLPIAIFDPASQSISLIHAGWEGLNKGIIRNVVDYFIKNFQALPSNLVVSIGPSIGPCCYTHTSPPAQLNSSLWKKCIFKKGGLYSIDLWSFAENQLKSLGVNPKNISNSKECTYHINKYFSHHKFINQKLHHDSRFATILGIRNVG